MQISLAHIARKRQTNHGIHQLGNSGHITCLSLKSQVPAGYPGDPMLWTIFAILLILWLLGWGFHVAGNLIHALLVIALIVAIINLATGRSTV
jgi:Family of unknown function (DUF5670)